MVTRGIHRLPEGARIYEAVDLAGGFTDDAEDLWLNLAEPVTDGMKLEVPSRAQAGDPAWQAQNQNALTGNRDAGNSVAGQHVLVNLNTASLEELMTLKGIGASWAGDIIRYRKEAGGFTKIERYHEGAGHQGRGLSENKRKYYSIGNR
ncbi:MAG: helix-hairpin-helix domain-containing protein [Clostridium sp.]